jgi:cadmium resistance protein CadD (predicted permease)
MFHKKKLDEIDNKLTYVIGYRNLYNIAVLMVAVMAYLTPDAITKAISLILIVLGLKWFLTQVRENLDTVYINEQLVAEKVVKVDQK